MVAVLYNAVPRRPSENLLSLAPVLDPVQALVSVAGVSLMVFLVWFATRRAAPVTLGDEAGVREWVGRELLGFTVGEVAVDADRRRAIAISAKGDEAALIFVMGRRPVAWRLPVARLGGASLQEAGDGKLAVDLPTGDFTRPHFSMTLSGAPGVVELLRAVQGGPA
jgi:hypothetical protein